MIGRLNTEAVLPVALTRYFYPFRLPRGRRWLTMVKDSFGRHWHRREVPWPRSNQVFRPKVDWSQTEALSFGFGWNQISAARSVAWVAADGLGQGKVGGQEVEFSLRMTAVLEQRGDEWLLVQSHVSLPAPGQEEGDSVPV